MSRACMPVLVGVACLVSEIWLPFKTAKFPFRGMDYSQWSSKNLIDWNQLKKFMQVGFDVKCMHTDFGARGLSVFGDKISLQSIKVKKINRLESAQNIYASRD